jgi:uncharacterized protein YndB with AHSA1/START domain
MAEIRHRGGIQASAERVYEALTTTEGIASWWWQDARGDADATGQVECYLGDSPMVAIEIAELEPNRRVRWRCVQGPDEWLETTITYDIDRDTDETAVTLTHAGWGEPTAFMGQCSTKWAIYLVGLKQLLEGGTATPFPTCPRVSSMG